MKEGTEDATNWLGKAGTGEYQALPLEGVAAGTAVTVKYSGTKKVKSVKAVKKAAAASRKYKEKQVFLWYFSRFVLSLHRETIKMREDMATIVLQVPDETLVSKVKQACKMLMGVTSVKIQKETKQFDITKTAGYREAMDDVKHGRVTHYDSVDDMFKDILGEEAFSKLRSSNV